MVHNEITFKAVGYSNEIYDLLHKLEHHQRHLLEVKMSDEGGVYRGIEVTVAVSTRVLNAAVFLLEQEERERNNARPN